MKYDNFIKQVKISEKELTQEEYDLIITPVKDVARDSNGYFILAILAATISYFSTVLNTWVSKYRAKKKGMDLSAQNQTNKILTFILPIIMGVFTLFYTAAFGLYIVAGSVISLITGPLITMFVDMLEFDAIKKANDRIMASYDRKRK
jgi:membrane protein insertase Oxa1/YidC/SpoIIIJ